MTGHPSHYNSQSCFIIYTISHQLIRCHVLYLRKMPERKMMHIHHLYTSIFFQNIIIQVLFNFLLEIKTYQN